MLSELNLLLASTTQGTKPPVLCLLTGSSGCGKTFLAKALDAVLDPKYSAVFYFDSIGVPSPEEMIQAYGSGEKWQEAMTHQWIQRLAQTRDKALVVLEGQFHPRFGVEGCAAAGVEDYCMAVVSCDEQVWEQRLRGPRGQPELVNDDMRNWARILREQTVQLGGSAIDTSASDVQRNLRDVARLVRPLVAGRVVS